MPMPSGPAWLRGFINSLKNNKKIALLAAAQRLTPTSAAL
jgi:hypothetical protein